MSQRAAYDKLRLERYELREENERLRSALSAAVDTLNQLGMPVSAKDFYPDEVSA